MSPPRLDLGAAADAERALSGIATDGLVSAEILTRLKGLPVLLRASGVPAVLAYFAAKSGPAAGSGGGEAALGGAYRKVRAALVTQLRDELGWEQVPTDLYQALADLPMADLARVHHRLETFAGWLRRLAEAREHEQNTGNQHADAPSEGNTGA